MPDELSFDDLRRGSLVSIRIADKPWIPVIVGEIDAAGRRVRLDRPREKLCAWAVERDGKMLGEATGLTLEMVRTDLGELRKKIEEDSELPAG